MKTVVNFQFLAWLNRQNKFWFYPLKTGFELKKYYRNTLKFLGLFLLIAATVIEVNAAQALQFGNRGIPVIELQHKLQEIGYFDGKITGYYGILTQNAVRQFQAANGLKVDGIAGDQTRAALGLSEAITTQTSQPTFFLKLGSSGSKVIEIQQYLQVMGYYNQPITGYYDLSTQQAVILFQNDVGLKADGIVGPLTQAAIESEFNSPPVSTSTSTPSSLPERGDYR
ncbi:MAG: peptidoglycan-binding protein [Lyngbya sp.]|nr:peptidoglycan-binding protein [Lyngbya sp.]